MFSRLVHGITVASASLAAVTLGYMAFATIQGVILRYVFRQPSRFLFESTEFSLALTVFLTFGFVAMRNGHIRVDLVPARFIRIRHSLDYFSRILTALFMSFLVWFAVQMFVRDLVTGMKMGSTFGLPRSVLTGALVVGLFLFAVNEILQVIQMMRRKHTNTETQAVNQEN